MWRGRNGCRCGCPTDINFYPQLEEGLQWLGLNLIRNTPYNKIN